MITHCKFCEKEIPAEKIGKDYNCSACNIYCIIYSHSASSIVDANAAPVKQPESETLKVGNYYLCYLIQYKDASVVETKDFEKRILTSFALEELTHDTALHWGNKLKTYVLFQ